MPACGVGVGTGHRKRDTGYTADRAGGGAGVGGGIGGGGGVMLGVGAGIGGGVCLLIVLDDTCRCVVCPLASQHGGLQRR